MAAEELAMLVAADEAVSADLYLCTGSGGGDCSNHGGSHFDADDVANAS